MITNEQIETLKSWADDYGTALAMRDALRTAIDTLEALPATRDGVRVTDGDEVWVRHNPAFRLTPSKYPVCVVLIDGYGSPSIHEIANSYSTEAAAERAAKEQGNGN